MASPKTETRPKRGRPRRPAAEEEETRARIIDAARTLFAREGYGGVSMRKLAEMAGLAPAALYAYFPGKRALLRFLWEDTFEAMSVTLARTAKRHTDPLARAEALALRFTRFWLERPDDYRAIFLIEDAPEGPAGSYFAQSSSSLRGIDLLYEALSEAIRTGALPDQDPEAATQILLSALQGVALNTITIPEYPWISAEKLARQTVRTVLAGLAAQRHN